MSKSTIMGRPSVMPQCSQGWACFCASRVSSLRMVGRSGSRLSIVVARVRRLGRAVDATFDDTDAPVSSATAAGGGGAGCGALALNGVGGTSSSSSFSARPDSRRPAFSLVSAFIFAPGTCVASSLRSVVDSSAPADPGPRAARVDSSCGRTSISSVGIND